MNDTVPRSVSDIDDMKKGTYHEVNPESWTQLKVHNETKMQLEEIVEG